MKLCKSYLSSALGLTLLVGAGYSQAATPGVTPQCKVSRDQIVSAIKTNVSSDELAAKYANCIAADIPSITTPGYPWSVFYEEIKACGYHPQRKEAGCRVDIKQAFGYAGVGYQGSGGSLEFVRFCVDYGAGLVPVNTNGFHVNDAGAASGNPQWNFAAILPADVRLFGQPLNRQALRARAILSWAMPPGGTCAQPQFVWGNVHDFRIRLDP